MPYYIFKIKASPTSLVKNLDLVTEFESFQEAKKFSRQLRAEQAENTPDNDTTIKVMFAGSILEAEEKLQAHREAPILQEWEK